MTDKREDILARLLVACGAVDGIQKAARNVDALSEPTRPAAIILDGDEQAVEGDPLGRPEASPRRIEMTPEIHVLLAGQPAEAGTSVNAMRAGIIKAVLTDSELADIVGANGHIRYEGTVTEFGPGRTLQARMRLAFTFTYILIPAAL